MTGAAVGTQRAPFARSAIVDANNAASSTEFAKQPTTSSVSETCLTPARNGSTRRHETDDSAERSRPDHRPAVCVPSANGVMCAATAAAEPLDDPPGVFQSVRVAGRARCEIGEFRGHGLAENVAARGAYGGNTGGVGARNATGVNRRAVFGGDARSVDHVFDGNR